MTRWTKFQDWVDVQNDLTQSDVTNATDFKGWCIQWINYVNDDTATVNDRPPVKPPHP